MLAESELKQHLHAIAANQCRVPDNVDDWQMTRAKYRHIAEWICAPIDETLYAITRFK